MITLFINDQNVSQSKTVQKKSNLKFAKQKDSKDKSNSKSCQNCFNALKGRFNRLKGVLID